MKYIIVIAATILALNKINAQIVEGNLKQHAGQSISLTGFNYYTSQELSKTVIDSVGNFTLNYPAKYSGMGILNTQDQGSLVMVLTGKNITITGTHLQEPSSLSFTDSAANTNYMRYANAQNAYGSALQAWKFLEGLYQKETVLKPYKKTKKQIAKELQRIAKADAAFLAGLDTNSYVRWFAPNRKLIQDMPAIVSKQTQRIPEAIQQFRTTYLTHPNFKTSGLYRELLEGHYLLLENMGQSLDSVYAQMNISTSYIVNNLNSQPELLNETATELFTLFEKRSLFSVAGHLSDQLITNHPNLLDDKFRSKMERYVSLKVGNKAPNIQLTPNKTLKDINNNVLLVFGSSECSYCTDANKKLASFYEAWQAKGNLEIVYISIDTDKAEFAKAYSKYPWNSYCDYKGWGTQSAKDYFIDATPTFVLLDKNQNILLHPRSIDQVNIWVNYNL
jgi:thioredoxin-related protein